MELNLNEFVAKFAEQFDETELSEFKPETEFRDLDEWSSLIGFAILNMITKQYGVKITLSEVTACSTIQDVFNLIQAKK